MSVLSSSDHPTPEPRPAICDYEGSDYQSSFWEQGGRRYEDQVEEIALRRLLPPKGKLLLELGAGAGRNTPRYGGFERIVLLDYSRTQLLQAQERLGLGDRFLYVAADIYRLPFVPALFDTATMIRTLHHMAEPELALKQVRGCLQPGGVFVLEYANKQNFKAIFRYLFRRQKWSPFSTEPVEFTHLNFDFHPGAIRTWVERSGFQIQCQLTVSHFRMDLLKRTLPLRLLVWMDSLAQWTGGLWQLTPSVFMRLLAVQGEAADHQTGFFRCPECGVSDLEKAASLLICRSCARRYSFEGGIYDFRQPVD